MTALEVGAGALATPILRDMPALLIHTNARYFLAYQTVGSPCPRYNILEAQKG